ncbi:LysR family transcriptional regulator [Vibrio sp. Hep-1b-8]|uniref:LysR family transcriptional regulator n=1 Tax=Vibrio sp. Hep-1b-8 TaxID=2144187 RepID=UPI001110DEF1|nr:LysR family transcriptional regulator [Vibrio sp. Hep-1b-8]TMX35841.1 LysR family transcriptional regulator [Vibrio sp. Hep-1b-8]
MKSQLDLNLLKVLPLLDKHRQLKPVAKELGKTESAVSKYLAKLREQLGDPLFVRGAFEFEPTEYTTNLLPKITAGLDMIDEAVQREEFNPALYDKSISIALPSLGQSLVGKALLLELMEIFPKAKINITTWNETSITDILDERLDIGVQYFNEELTKTIFQHHLGKYKGAIICAKPYADRSLEEKLRMPYIMMELKGWQDTKAVTNKALEEQGIEINTFATVDNITCLFDVLECTECATLLPYTNHTQLHEKYCVTALPDHLQMKHPPSVVANYKLVNHGNPLHQLLASKVKQHLF